jgi:hypothetical protein
MCNSLVAHILVEKLFYVNPFSTGCEVDRLGSSRIAVSSHALRVRVIVFHQSRSLRYF